MTGKSASEARGLLEALPDVFLELSGTGTVVRYIGGGAGDQCLVPAALTGKKLAECWPAAAARRMSTNIRKAIISRGNQVFTIEFGESADARYEVRLFVQGRDRVLAVLRRHAEHAEPQASRPRSFIDTLTGLATRDRFLMELENVLAEARLRERGVGLMCIDIDRFTRINETLGRRIGDEVLKIAAQRIERCFRDQDQLVSLQSQSALARVGGDEFVLVLGGIESRDSINAVANRVIESFVEPLQCADHSLTISPSIGIALFPEDGDDAEALFSSARAAVDQARDFGATGAVFYSGGVPCASSTQDLGRELRWALDKNQLELHYLPRVDLKTEVVTGVEALLRWRHPIRGFVPLSQIIPLAETTGLMRPIGEWALGAACVLARRLGEEFEQPPVVSINLSQREFTRSDLPELMSAVLAKSGLAGERLQLEFTEASLMGNRQSRALLERLDALGIHLAIDDFGTGHVSLAGLQDLPISALKIDRSFVSRIHTDQKRRNLCAAIIAMGRQLGLSVVAEGVESSQQAELLQQFGCEAAQGHFYSRPLLHEQVLNFVSQRMPDSVQAI